jgi:serine/threonine protein kinase
VSVRADIFSLGCLIYELMTGTFPYEGQSDKDIKDWYSRGIFPNTKALGPAGSVITKCWQGKHARCAEVVKDLKRCQKPRGTISPVLESPSRPCKQREPAADAYITTAAQGTAPSSPLFITVAVAVAATFYLVSVRPWWPGRHRAS